MLTNDKVIDSRLVIVKATETNKLWFYTSIFTPLSLFSIHPRQCIANHFNNSFFCKPPMIQGRARVSKNGTHICINNSQIKTYTKYTLWNDNFFRINKTIQTPFFCRNNNTTRGRQCINCDHFFNNFHNIQHYSTNCDNNINTIALVDMPLMSSIFIFSSRCLDIFS